MIKLRTNKSKMISIKPYIFSVLILTGANMKAQNALSDFLNAVSTNNKTIIAAKQYAKSQKLEAKTGISPENPEFEFGYFPGNSNEIGTKKVIGISQSIDFPSTYVYKNKIASTSQSIANIEYEQIVLKVLFEAKNAYYEAIYLNKILNNVNKRTADASKMLEFYLKKQENGDATQLEVNKARLFLLSIQNQQRLNNSKIKQNTERIKQLNGNKTFEISQSDFMNQRLESWQKIESEIDSLLPDFKYFNLSNEQANIEIKLSKSEWLPDFTVGYESEDVLGDKYSGFKAGITIPLWENKNQVKKAKADLISLEARQDEYITIEKSRYFSKYIEAETLQQNLNNFQTSIGEMNNEYLLSRSLELGQISAIEYFMELDYFYKIQDELLALEYQYQQSLVELYRYKK